MSTDWEIVSTPEDTQPEPSEMAGDWEIVSQPEQESDLKGGFRTLLQPVMGAAKFLTWPFQLAKDVGVGKGLSEWSQYEPEIGELFKEQYGREWSPEERDEARQSYLSSVMETGEKLPTQEKAEQLLEEKGIPVEARTGGQKALRLGGEAASFALGGAVSSPARWTAAGVAGISAPVISKGLQEIGVPEGISDTFGLILSGIPASQAESLANKFESAKKFIAEGTGKTEKEASTFMWNRFKENLKDKSKKLFNKIAAAEKSPTSVTLNPDEVSEAEEILTKTADSLQKGEPTAEYEIGREIQESLPKQEKTQLAGITREVAPKTFESEAQGGRNLEGYVKTQAEKEKGAVNKAYNVAEQEYSGVNAIYPKLANKIEGWIETLGETAEPNTAESKSIKLLQSLQKNVIGDKTGLREVPVRTLIKTADSLGSSKLYDLPYIGPKGFIRSIVHELNQGAKEAITKAGKDVSKLEKADKMYGGWADKFLTDEIKPYLKKGGRNPEELFKRAVSDPTTMRSLTAALEKSARGTQSLAKVQKELAELQLAKYFKKPDTIGNSEYKRTISNLKELLPTKKVASIDKKLQQYAQRKPRITGATPSDYAKYTKSVEGIKELERELRRLKVKPSVARNVKEKSAANVLSGGKTEATPESIKNALQNSDKRRLLIELLGSKKVGILEDALKVAEKAKMLRKTLKDARINQTKRLADATELALTLATKSKTLLLFKGIKYLRNPEKISRIINAIKGLRKGNMTARNAEKINNMSK